jgi:protein-S-isoprenylcysteine O-methyltransferase Ste14
MSTTELPHPFNQKLRLAALWLMSAGVAAVILLSQPQISEESMAHEATETVGLALLILAVMGRLWSILYIGAKKNQELVTFGPYSVTRNPLYFFSITGLLGIGLVFGSLTLAIALLVTGSVVFHYTAMREADFLKAKFGSVYADYAGRTPLILPRPWLYSTSESITFSARALSRTLRDCLPFLVLYPLIELVEYWHEIGLLKPIFVLP